MVLVGRRLSYSLGPIGYDVLEILLNVRRMQLAWARENGFWSGNGTNLQEIAIAQAERFEPDALWFDDDNIQLLARLRSQIGSLKLVMGWAGSALPETTVWNQMDVVLSCAPESVQRLNCMGHRAIHIHHGFDRRINERLRQRPKKFEVTFVGSLVKGAGYHDARENFLTKIADGVHPWIFCPEAEGEKGRLKSAAKKGRDFFLRFLERFDSKGSVRRILKNRYRPGRTQGRFADCPLGPYLKPGVFGLDMFQCLRDLKVVLNVHADSSPMYASNMRLLETTGVGSCLVTEDKENIRELFEPDQEVVIYRSAEECIEKVNWLLNHPAEGADCKSGASPHPPRSHLREKGSPIRSDHPIGNEQIGNVSAGINGAL